MKVYCYATGPIDECWGSTLFSDAPWADDEVKRFKRNAEVGFRVMHWEGDTVQGPDMFVVPDPEVNFWALGMALKQSNNGSVYVACQVPLLYLSAQSLWTCVVEHGKASPIVTNVAAPMTREDVRFAESMIAKGCALTPETLRRLRDATGCRDD